MPHQHIGIAVVRSTFVRRASSQTIWEASFFSDLIDYRVKCHGHPTGNAIPGSTHGLPAINPVSPHPFGTTKGLIEIKKDQFRHTETQCPALFHRQSIRLSGPWSHDRLPELYDIFIFIVGFCQSRQRTSLPAEA